MSAHTPMSSSRPAMRARTTSSSSMSSSPSVAPSSPGPSVSIRATRSPTPTNASHAFSSSRDSPNPNDSAYGGGGGHLGASTSSSRSNSYAGAGGSGARRPAALQARERSSGALSSASTATGNRTANAPSGHQHSRRRPTLMGGGGKLGRSQLANLAAGNGAPDSARLHVPPILVNGSDRPEDVDISSIGRVTGPAANGMHGATSTYTTPQATSAGVDALFARFGVKEVRGIAVRGRDKADAKREELRTMVGERYRDLLGAADSIVRMRRSSAALLGRLSRTREECDRDNMVARAAEEDMTRSRLVSRAATPPHGYGEASSSGYTPYSIATLVKLLLDCPEHIWRAIEKEEYLEAARLEGIGRAVYRELVSSGRPSGHARRARQQEAQGTDEDEGGYSLQQQDSDEDEAGQQGDDLLAAFPLMEQTGDTLDQLSPQISQRSKRSLTVWDVESSTVAASLASIVLLDNASVPDALESTLGARAQTLAALLAEGAESVKPPSSRRPSATLSALASSSSLPASGNDAEDVVRKATEALGLILRTHEHVETVFVRQSHNTSEQPLLLLLLAQLQQQPSAAPAGADWQPNRTPTAGDIGLVPILNTLPNAHLLLRYLPSQIIAFTPFVDTTSARNVLTAESAHSTLATWFSNALATFETGLTRLLAAVASAKQLASSRSALHSFLNIAKAGQGALWNGQIASLTQTVDRVLHKRFGEIYNMRLRSFLQSMPETLQAALRALSGSAEDLDPSLFLFSSAIPFPSSSLFSSSLSPSGASKNPAGSVVQRSVREAGDPFVMFQKAIGKRVAGRPPLLDTCLGELEAVASSIRSDVTAWLDGGSEEDERVAGEYQSAVMNTLQEMGDLLRTSLEGATDIAQQLFVGSVALHIALESSLVPDLRLSDTFVPDNTRQKLLDIERASLQRWHGATLGEVTDNLQRRFTESLELPPAETPSKPSDYLFLCLTELARAVGTLGPHRAQAAPDAVNELLGGLEEQLRTVVYADAPKRLAGLDQKARIPATQQVRLDLAFLREFLRRGLGQKEGHESMGRAALDRELEELAPVSSAINAWGAQALQRSQNLLSPLLSFGSGPALAGLLPLGPPPLSSAVDFKLEVSKPGARFALLQVAQTAA